MRASAAVSLSFAIILASQATAQEPAAAQIEFVQKLRVKGYNDLALEYIDKHKSEPGLAEPLRLERARALAGLARSKEAEQQAPLFAAARAELDAFIQKNPSGPEAAQARLEIARLVAYQGQTLLRRALRDDDVAAARRAEQQFIQASRELETAIKVLEGLKGNFTAADKEKTDQIRQRLSQEWVQARFDRASNYLDQALTYIDTSNDADNRKRAEAIDQAKQAFKTLAAEIGRAHV